MDNELSVRAGLNIGIEPTLLPFMQAGAGNVFPISPTGDTLIAEHTDQAARVVFSAGEFISGYLWNTTSAPLTAVQFFFKDELGNEIPISPVFDLSNIPGPEEFFFSSSNGFDFVCLAPGEKILARLVPPQQQQ